jgi:PAT family beta-lactamase induction signal transducer AmpG
MTVLAALGFCGGLPNVMAASVVSVWASVAGWSVQAIGLIALMTFPYALKFLWAPLVDRVRLPWSGALGQRRSWLVVGQIGAAGALLGMAWCGAGPTAPGEGQTWTPEVARVAEVRNALFMALLAVMVLFSATQDIVADAYRTEVLERRLFGVGAAFFVSGFRVAFVVVGALVLQAADRIGWGPAVACVGLMALVGACVPLLAPEPPRRAPPEPGLRAAVVEPVAELWRTWGARVLVLGAFVLLFRLPDQLANAMTSPLLVRGLGYTPSDIGWVRQGLGFTLTIAGALTGGWLVARLGIVRCLWIFGALQALSNAGFMVLARAYHATEAVPAAAGSTPVLALVPVIAIEAFAGGLVSAGFVAFLMSVCSLRNVATQYALLTALMAASGALGGALSGWMTHHMDYEGFFLASVLAGAPGVALIAFVRRPPLPRAESVRLGSVEPARAGPGAEVAPPLAAR